MKGGLHIYVAMRGQRERQAENVGYLKLKLRIKLLPYERKLGER